MRRFQLTKGDNSRIGLDDTFVGKQPATQPELKRARLLFLQRVEEHLLGNWRDIHCLAPSLFCCGLVSSLFVGFEVGLQIAQ